MNKKQLAAFPQEIAFQIQADNPGLSIEEAQTLVGIALKKLRPQIVALATPAKEETPAA